MNINFSEIFTSFLMFLPRLAVAVIIFLAFWIIARILRGIVLRFGRTRHLSPDIINMMEQVTEAALIVFGIVTALGTLGVDMGAIIAGLGLVGFALGFALKDLLSNFLAGFLILLYNPFIRGDHIEVSGNSGRVLEVNMRYTVLQGDDKRILIPNSTLFQNPVIVQRQAQTRLPGSDSSA